MKEYKFYGVDFKTELKLAIIVGLIFIILWPAFIFFYYKLSGLEYLRWIPKSVFFGAMIIALAIALISLHFLGKKFRKLWLLQIKDKKILIEYNKKKKEINLDQIIKIIINGGSELRYFTIITSIEKIKIRLGTGVLAPFSKKKDLEEIDYFTKQLQPYLNQNFIKNDRRVRLSPPGTIKLTYTRKT
ncbi:hypothetical protein ETU09_00110 [Apibacter muscae]|uniref:DUF304 domain-containing protein n=1 Tax=Apibacter muscae TaxID=2509004 RepID=A0A563DLN2_9FLAO|nr:hypothetical protein [Apibacter muscae]TWP30803.1 hypothetical protein ETU09_00110 [Apibacter muscae]